MNWTLWSWLILAGGLGTASRYVVSGWVQRAAGAGFPWGTLCVNVTGCFLFALLWTLAEERLLVTNQTRMVVFTGFMGAFTTFSTFAFETSEMMRDAEWLMALGNVAAQNVVGLAAVFLGFVVGRLL